MSNKKKSKNERPLKGKISYNQLKYIDKMNIPLIQLILYSDKADATIHLEFGKKT